MPTLLAEQANVQRTAVRVKVCFSGRSAPLWLAGLSSVSNVLPCFPVAFGTDNMEPTSSCPKVPVQRAFQLSFPTILPINYWDVAEISVAA